MADKNYALLKDNPRHPSLLHLTIRWSWRRNQFAPRLRVIPAGLRITHMPVPVSTEQRQEIRSLSADGLTNKEIAAKMGLGLMQVAGVKAAETRGTYDGGENSAAAEEAEVASAVDTAFGLERDLQHALRRSIDQLEQGLIISDGDKEQTGASGRIDITARDQRGTTVVIELKAGAADRDAIGQILAYMGDLMENETRVRGILVAREFSPRAVSAARATANIRLVQYGVQFTFDTVVGPAA